jgi:NADH:ubiquinone oxidoreductase subunit 3 (subunit A)
MNNTLYSNYTYILIYIVIASLISIIILALSYILVSQEQYNEKNSAYECGFAPFEDARNKFEIKFYLVAILFIIFDLEVSYLFPWISLLDTLSYEGFWPMFIFLFILTIGFVYEWMKGALDWS